MGQFIDLTGQKLNKWTILEQDLSRLDSHTHWKCQCECGRIRSIAGYRLIAGYSKQCRKCINWQGYEDISKTYFSQIKSGATDRNLEFDLSIEDMWDLYIKQTKRCTLSDIEIYFAHDMRQSKTHQTASLDRIDSNKGYIKDNVQWVHKNVNNMKMNIPQEKFIEWCKLIANNN